MEGVFLKGINLVEKTIRARVIAEYLAVSGINRCVCFSCGNSARLLKGMGLDVIHIGEGGDLKPIRWFSLEDIQKTFNGLFDATSGNLPDNLMCRIADELRKTWEDTRTRQRLFSSLEGERFFDYSSMERFNPDSKGTYLIPTGSGETITCLQLAFPSLKLIPVRIRGNPNTELHEGYSLNSSLIEKFGSYGDCVEIPY
jgi:hypothetical protein